MRSSRGHCEDRAGAAIPPDGKTARSRGILTWLAFRRWHKSEPATPQSLPRITAQDAESFAEGAGGIKISNSFLRDLCERLRVLRGNPLNVRLGRGLSKTRW